MISPENPYVLPSVVVGAAVYLGLSFFSDLSVLVRLGVLVGIVGVVPAVLNRLLGGSTDDVTAGAAVGDTTDPDDVADAAVDAADGTADAADVADGDINDLDDAGVTDDSTDGRAT